MDFTPLTGSCRCGRVRIGMSRPPVMTAACHCRGCQRMSSSAFSLTAMVPAQGFQVLAGDPVAGGLRGPELDHRFCPDCMSWIFTRIHGWDEMVNVRPVMFEDLRWAEPFLETMAAEKLPWVNLPVRRSYAGFPPEADFPDLLAQFAAERL
ncbi:MAG: GFA family protein [Rhodobacteraceae bacterium]|nr:GFA family protein [Paracoccaceae bacterium]